MGGGRSGHSGSIVFKELSKFVTLFKVDGASTVGRPFWKGAQPMRRDISAQKRGGPRLRGQSWVRGCGSRETEGVIGVRELGGGGYQVHATFGKMGREWGAVRDSSQRCDVTAPCEVPLIFSIVCFCLFLNFHPYERMTAGVVTPVSSRSVYYEVTLRHLPVFVSDLVACQPRDSRR